MGVHPSKVSPRNDTLCARAGLCLFERSRLMFLDLNSERRWEEGPSCMSCKRPIASDERSEQVRLPFDAEHKTHELNGLYHFECARPYLSVIRAMESLTRWSR